MLQAISRCTISSAVAVILTPQTQLCNRVSPDAFDEA
jgi:hypothetical protein